MYYTYSSNFIFFIIMALIALTIYCGIKKSKAGVKAGVISVIGVFVWYLLKRASFAFTIMKYRFMWGFSRFTDNLSFLVHVIIAFIILYFIFKIFGKK